MLAWENKAIFKGAEQETEVSLLQFLWEEMDHPHERLTLHHCCRRMCIDFGVCIESMDTHNKVGPY